MGELEARLGIRATFYIMTASPYYNPRSREGVEALRQLMRCGHALGVHLELDLARDASADVRTVAALADADRRRLPAPIGTALSIHCPPDALVWVDVPRFDYAMAPRWRGRYLSDSRGVFSFGDPEDHAGRPLQVNLHPEHWFGGLPPVGDRPEFWR